MRNFITWGGMAEDGRSAEEAHSTQTYHGEDAPNTLFNWNWGGVPFKWGDVQLLIEAVQAGGSSKRRRERQEKLDKWLDQEPDKKKRLLKLVATVNGQDYIETKEVEEVKVNIMDVEILIKEVFSRIIVEKKDV